MERHTCLRLWRRRHALSDPAIPVTRIPRRSCRPASSMTMTHPGIKRPRPVTRTRPSPYPSHQRGDGSLCSSGADMHQHLSSGQNFIAPVASRPACGCDDLINRLLDCLFRAAGLPRLVADFHGADRRQRAPYPACIRVLFSSSPFWPLLPHR